MDLVFCTISSRMSLGIHVAHFLESFSHNFLPWRASLIRRTAGVPVNGQRHYTEQMQVKPQFPAKPLRFRGEILISLKA
jgi:hypothetical protein